MKAAGCSFCAADVSQVLPETPFLESSVCLGGSVMSSLFFPLFYCYFFFTSGFFIDLVQSLPCVALYKALSGSKVSVPSWSPGTLGSPLFEISATVQEVLALYSFAYCLDV